MRTNGRKPSELRKIEIVPNYLLHPHGSAFIKMGNTKVICSAFMEERVPPWMMKQGTGWVTAEYSMIPGATKDRTNRESSRGKVGGRTHEIQRLIGRSFRPIYNLAALGERTIWLDCDVIQADGGTRTASITGAFIALALATKKMKDAGVVSTIPISDYVGAVSIGIINGEPYLDLDYEEDYTSAVDMNFVMTGKGEFIEVQGTAEQNPFDEKKLNGMMELAKKGIREIVSYQKEIVGNIINI